MNTSTIAPPSFYDRQIDTPSAGEQDTRAALRFVTCGSVDDGKSTLIGRLLVDSKTVLQDQLAGVQRGGQTDLALLTDGLQAEREQGITIDVAYRYFNTAARKFIIADAPGHEQYTRNMVTAASSADAAVVLVDATKLDWQSALPELLPQTRRHSLLVNLLRVPAIVFAVNKLDAVDNPALAFAHISAALRQFAEHAGIPVKAIVPVSALIGYNVVDANPGWCDYNGPGLLQILEHLSSNPADTTQPFALPVQWVEKPAPTFGTSVSSLPPEGAVPPKGGLSAELFSSSADTSQGRRIFWGRIASGALQPGQEITVLPGGKTAIVAQVLNHARQPKAILAGHSAGVILDRELDVSRGDWLLATGGFEPPQGSREITATVAWMDEEPLVPGRLYWALHGHRWVKAKIKRIVSHININTLESHDASKLDANAIGVVEIALLEPIAALPYKQSRVLGSLVLVDTASHKTSGAALVL
ncbi:sulfate adenylyltransferase subunit 1 [Polaromonas sp.]|uniref:sulfate adenylyltransferase subunit 1 n=1 Tax=Polaromonas sp. TaxID=1869339 RepID=UPI003BAC18A8